MPIVPSINEHAAAPRAHRSLVSKFNALGLGPPAKIEDLHVHMVL
jgi:hypothetical protein